MDDKSTKTLSSLNTKVDREVWWYGQLPCVCHSLCVCHSHSVGPFHRGCHRHNPSQSPIYRNPLLPPKAQEPGCFGRIFSWLRDAFSPEAALGIFSSLSVVYSPETASEHTSEPFLLFSDSWAKEHGPEPEPPSLFYTELPFDSRSFNTLVPIHPTMPYHLAFYHLDCVRRRLDPDVKVAFIPELSCSGNTSFCHNGPGYAWSSEIYFDKGAFLQKQEISYSTDRETCSLRLTGCPHMSLTIKGPWFEDDDGFPKFMCTIPATETWALLQIGTFPNGIPCWQGQAPGTG
ncbi:hypothetical protein F5X99DRAFT_411431 [Biscogniauxia marginata]|nr:hypothetical protein F5X99DRAFT_411431 [Biscogniauxia marginata]